MLEPAVLVLELLEPQDVIPPQAAILRLPAVARLVADPVGPARLGDLPAALRLLWEPDDLLLAELWSNF